MSVRRVDADGGVGIVVGGHESGPSLVAVRPGRVRDGHEQAGRRESAGPAGAQRGVPSPVVPRWVGALLCGLGVALVPWVVYLHTGLPATAQASHWAWTWTGLDALEAAGLVSTGLLLRRGDLRASLAATAAAVLLTVDAWFDTMTAAPGADLASALAMAAGAELPLAAVCAVIAWRGFPRRV